MRRKKIGILGFTLLEVLVVVGIMLVITAGMLPSWSTFSSRQDVETSTYKLYQDFRQAWQFSRGLRDNYKYYGIRFYDNLGDDNSRSGYKILLFCQTDASGDCPVIATDPAVPFDPSVITCNSPSTTSCNFIKSSVSADNPEFLENTFFSKSVVITGTEIVVGDTVIFTPLGSATTDGLTLLPTDKDSITIGKGSYSKTIIISALTGNVEIQLP